MWVITGRRVFFSFGNLIPYQGFSFRSRRPVSFRSRVPQLRARSSASRSHSMVRSRTVRPSGIPMICESPWRRAIE